MRRTYTDRVFEYYRKKDDEYDFVGEEFGGSWRGGRGDIKDSSLKKILIVDDEEHIRNMYSRFFSRRGFDVQTAQNAMEAKDLMVQDKIDLVFLDIKMAEVEGDILFELVRAFHRNVRVVVFSVYPIEEQKERIKDADAYFDKSDGQDALLGLVSNLVRGEG